MVQIIPAILSTSEDDYQRDISRYKQSTFFKEGWVHIDFMDNIFVPNKSIEPSIVDKYTINLHKEAHLMVVHPVDWVDDLVKAGINVETKKSKQTLQIDVYVPPPTGGSGFSCPKGETVCCPGGLVDFGVSCTQNGKVICSVFDSVDAKQDTNEVCTKGTFSKSDTITPTPGSDPCVDFARTAGFEIVPKALHTGKTGIPTTCQISVSPC